MKRFFQYIFFAFAITGLLVSLGCQNEDGDTTPPSNVNNLKGEPGFGMAYLIWELPTDPDLLYVRVDYQDTLGKAVHQKFSTFIDTAVIEDLNMKEFIFTICTVDNSGNHSSELQTKVVPNNPKLRPPKSPELNSEEVFPYWARISWSWPGQSDIEKIALNYINGSGEAVSREFNKGTNEAVLADIVPEKEVVISGYCISKYGSKSKNVKLSVTTPSGSGQYSFVDSKIAESVNENLGNGSSQNAATFDALAGITSLTVHYQISKFDDLIHCVNLKTLHIEAAYPPSSAPDVSALAKVPNLETIEIDGGFPLDKSHFSGGEFSHLTIVKN